MQKERGIGTASSSTDAPIDFLSIEEIFFGY